MFDLKRDKIFVQHESISFSAILELLFELYHLRNYFLRFACCTIYSDIFLRSARSRDFSKISRNTKGPNTESLSRQHRRESRKLSEMLKNISIYSVETRIYLNSGIPGILHSWQYLRSENIWCTFYQSFINSKNYSIIKVEESTKRKLKNFSLR